MTANLLKSVSRIVLYLPFPTSRNKFRLFRLWMIISEIRHRNHAKEVAEGYECGVTLAKFADVKEGDVYEAFKMEEYRD